MPRELTIGELCARSGVSSSALRFYERFGLIGSRRTDGNQRRYNSATLRRVALIQAGKAAGIPLERIRTALGELPAERTPTKRDWERLSRAWRAELDARIRTLEAIRGRLTTCIGCGCLSLQTCRLLNPDDEAAALGAGAHYFTNAGEPMVSLRAPSFASANLARFEAPPGKARLRPRLEVIPRPKEGRRAAP